jgi:pimeloyl-ACP methyl ester carboxylesterase
MESRTDTVSRCALTAHDGIPMAADCGGEGSPALLFIHGWTCRRAYWQPQLAHFKSGHRVAAPDLPGHGETSGAGRSTWSIDRLARDIAACSLELTPDKAVLIGHSMGGAVALEAARQMPAATAAVVLVDTFVIDYGGLSSEAIEEAVAPFAADFSGAVAGLVEQTATDATPGPLKERLVREMSAADPSLALPLWRDLLAWDPQPAFDSLQVPIYAINGALIPESARARCAPFVSESVIDGAGHFLQMEDPAGFNQVLEKILDGLR